MSQKSTKSTKKLSIPREMSEIQSAYQQLCANAGQVQYTIVIHQKELDKLNERLEAVNNEAAARKQLDAQKAATETPAQEQQA